MSTHQSDSTRRSDDDRGTETRLPFRAKRAGSTLAGTARNGSLAVLTGGALLMRAVRAASRNRNRSGARAAAHLLAGAALFAVGLRQRRSADGSGDSDGGLSAFGGTESEESDDQATHSKTVADDARAARERDDVMSQDETNPRGVSGESDVETVTGDDEGDVRFTTGGEEPRPKPSLDDAERTDPRVDDGEDGRNEGVEIDLSDAAMADEASEATGPTPEQSYPAREGTDPEPTSEKAPERRG
ncbi:hypothetical protein, partial [Natrinema salifodinae]